MSENLNWCLGLPWWPGGPHIGGIRRRLNHFRLSHFPKTKKLEGGKMEAKTQEKEQHCECLGCFEKTTSMR